MSNYREHLIIYGSSSSEAHHLDDIIEGTTGSSHQSSYYLTSQYTYGYIATKILKGHPQTYWEADSCYIEKSIPLFLQHNHDPLHPCKYRTTLGRDDRPPPSPCSLTTCDHSPTPGMRPVPHHLAAMLISRSPESFILLATELKCNTHVKDVLQYTTRLPPSFSRLQSTGRHAKMVLMWRLCLLASLWFLQVYKTRASRYTEPPHG